MNTEPIHIIMKIRPKPKPLPDLEAITFEELVEHGKSTGAPVINGMPWSFHYKNTAVTHENDDCYIVGGEHFRRGDMLVSEGDGQPVPFSRAEFDEEYEEISSPVGMAPYAPPPTGHKTNNHEC
jgi:hypothetical protein